jgi:hypothetical protein
MIAFAGEQCLRFQLRDVIFGVAQLAIELLEQVVALLGVGLFLREVNVSVEVAGERNKLFVRADLIFGSLAIA